MNILGYEVMEKLYESLHSVIYRAVQGPGCLPVIIKLLNQEHPASEELTALRREYELLKRLTVSGVIQAQDMLVQGSSAGIIFEDIGGLALNQINFSEWTLVEKLELFDKIISILQEVHTRGIVHKDINPANIIFNRQTGETRIIDFSGAGQAGQENVLPPKTGLEGTLHYIAPEQTGRMNRRVDYRADYYSLGATFYELLSGRCLFADARDPLELIHYQLAKEPMPLQEVQRDIPASLSGIVMKMLAKNPEDRYQSAAGIKADICYCLEQLRAWGRVEEFPLAVYDNLNQFMVPEKFYGRKNEIGQLMNLYEWVSSGHREIVLVGGAAGIGKSRFVHAIRSSVEERQGCFVAGSYEKHRQAIPYSAIIDIARELTNLVLAEDEMTVQQLRRSLQANISNNGSVLVQAVPELAFILGTQPPAQELPAQESQQRFRFILRQFFEAFLEHFQALVLFLDNLHWADAASLELLKHISSFNSSHNILVICAYRDSETGVGHTLFRQLQDWAAGDTILRKIMLPPLARAEVYEMVGDALQVTATQAKDIARVIYDKTGGVPALIKAFLAQLYDEGLVVKNPLRPGWQWDITRIERTAVAGSVSEWIMERITHLPGEHREILKYAAVLGSSFSYSLLQEITGRDSQLLDEVLQEALRDGVLQVGELPGIKEPQFKFIHDDIQQVLYSLLPEQKRAKLHWAAGNALKAAASGSEAMTTVADIVYHLNIAQTLQQQEVQEQQELGRLNFLAGQRAKQALGFAAALVYFKKAIACLGETVWRYNYPMALELYLEAMEAAYSCTAYEDMENYGAIALERTDDIVAKMKIYEIKIVARLGQNQLTEALELAVDAFRHFRIGLPGHVSKVHLLYKLLSFKLRLRSREIEQISSLPVMQNEEQIAVMRLLAAAASLMYLKSPELFVLLVLKQLEISLRYGVSVHTPFVFALYGMILCSMLKDFDTGYRFGKIAMEILERQEHKGMAGKTRVVASIFVLHWKEPPEKILAELDRAFSQSLEAGNVEYAGWALLCYAIHAFFAGQELPPLYTLMLEHAAKIKKELRQEKQYDSLLPFIQLTKKLRETGSDTYNLSDAEYDEGQCIRKYQERSDQNGLYYIYSSQLILHVVFGRYELAVQAAGQAQQHLGSVLSTINFPVFYYYSTLAYLGKEAPLTVGERQTIKSGMKHIRRWAKVSPANHQHRLYLLMAESQRRGREFDKAARYYDLAIEWALQYGFTQDAALAYELASCCFAGQSKRVIARAYMIEAHYLYKKWGADEKVRLLEEDNSYLKKHYLARDFGNTASSMRDSQGIDTASIVKITQLLAGEMQYDTLIRHMMRIFMENAGARKGVFLLCSEGGLKVEAAAAVSDTGLTVSRFAGAEASELYGEAIVNYVLRREQALVLDNALQEGLFMRDAYVLKYRPKSVLCIPVRTKNKLMGILYFENDLTVAAFTYERTEFLNIIAAQAAISLENINMYTGLENTVRERTRELEIQKSYFKQLFASSPDAIVLLDNQLCIRDINQAFQTLFQYSPAEICGRHIDEVLVPAAYVEERRRLVGIRVDDTMRFESARCRRDGSLVEVFVTVYPIMEEEIQMGMCVMYSDISSRKEAERQLRYLSLHDALTGLFNRAYFEAELVKWEEAPQRVGMAILDLDGLKLVNDTLGHRTGDRMIQAAADIVRKAFGSEVTVARIGGDEFAVLLPEATKEQLAAYDEQLQEVIARHNETELEYSLSLSLGFAIKENTSISMADVYKEADANMYHRKVSRSDQIKQEILAKILAVAAKGDFFDQGHGANLENLSAAFASVLGLTDTEQQDLRLLARYHDIGKAVLPATLIYKEERLTAQERLEIRKHPEVGYRIAAAVPDARPVAELILRHHEWWDGSGYPLGLAGEEIPLVCRVFAIVEAYEVMTAGRPYAAAKSREEALEELKRCFGTQFDERLAAEFIKVMAEK